MILDIDLVSDFVCPWCFIGKRRLALALEEIRRNRPELEVRLNWLPFFLNPDTPSGGEPYRAFLEAKFGGPRQVDELQQRVAQAGAPDGVQFAFERIALRPNTLKAHRLMYRMQSQGAHQHHVLALGEALFAAHFQEGRDIGDTATLAEIAARCGEGEAAVSAYLDSDADAAKVRQMAEGIRRQGITGVPFFIINRKLGLSGAQSAAILGAAILQSLA